MRPSSAFENYLRRAVWLADERLGLRVVRTRGWKKEDKYLSLAYQSTLRRLLADAGINCVLDVGANTGQFGRALRNVGYRGRIESFEPASSPYRALTEATRDDPGWSIHRVALGRTPGEARLNVSRQSNFNSLRAPVEQYANLFQSADGGALDEEVVSVSRLDDVWPEIRAGSDDVSAFLKIDTQGFDDEVIAGGEGKAIPDVKGLQFETSFEHIYQGMGDWYGLIEHCRGLGFKVVGLFPCARGEMSEVVEMDCLMIRPEVYQGSPAPPRLQPIS